MKLLGNEPIISHFANIQVTTATISRPIIEHWKEVSDSDPNTVEEWFG